MGISRVPPRSTLILPANAIPISAENYLTSSAGNILYMIKSHATRKCKCSKVRMPHRIANSGIYEERRRYRTFRRISFWCHIIHLIATFAKPLNKTFSIQCTVEVEGAISPCKPYWQDTVEVQHC